MKVFSTLPRNLVILFTIGLLYWSSIASLLPTLPTYITDIGGNKQEVGIVMGSFAIGLLLFRPTLGKIADVQGRIIVLILGTIIGAIAPLGYLFVKSIPLLMIIRAINGISIAAFTTAYSALVVDLAPLDKRGEIIGYMSLVQPIGVALGPAIGGLVQITYGYSPLFIMASGLAVVTTIASTQIGQVPPLNYSPSPDEKDRINIWYWLITKPLGIPTLVLLVVGFAFGSMSTFIPLYIRETGANLNPGLFYTAAALASFSMRVFIGKASDRYGRGVFITGSLVSYSISMFLLSFAHDRLSFIIAAILEGAGAGTLIPMMIALISDRADPQYRGRVFSLCISGFDLGIAISGPILGGFIDQIGYYGIFSLSTVLVTLGLITFLTCASNNLVGSLGFALGRMGDGFRWQEVGSTK